MAQTSKKFLVLGLLFSAFAILFSILYYLNVISTLDLFLSVTYVAYFVGLALLYNGAYNKEKKHKKATAVNYLIGLLFVVVAIGMLIYGFSTGLISFI